MSHSKIRRGQSLEEYAYEEVRQMIIGGELEPGAQLVQEELAAKLGVSRTPLRRAIANLQHDNFVHTTPRGEAFVLAFGPTEIASIFEIRAVLEGLTCRLIAPTIKTKDTFYLRSLITAAAARTLENEEDWSAYRQADIEFHSYLNRLADNTMLVRLLDSFQVMGLSFAQGLLRPPDETLDEHLAILDALEAHDQDRAEQEMISHIRKTIALMNAKKEQQPLHREASAMS